MKILIVMGGFFPGKKYGGPPVSVNNFCSLMEEYDCYIVTKNHDMDDQTPYTYIHPGWNDMTGCKVLYLFDHEYNIKTFAKIMHSIKPDLIYLQGLFQSCVIQCLVLSKKYSIPILVAPRGELCSGALNIKKFKKSLYITGIKALGLTKAISWQSTSAEETEAIQKWMNAKKENIFELSNIPSVPRKTYAEHRKVPGEGRIVFLSRIHPKKNLIFALECFQHIREKAEFDIYGPIEDSEYWKQCNQVIARMPENVTVTYKDLVNHEQVHEIFSQYDAFFFPTLSENYGHVIMESLMVGTPVIISDQTPWSDVQKYGAGFSADLQNKNAFIDAVETIINSSPEEYRGFRRAALNYASEKLKIEKLKCDYRNALMRITEGKS